MRTFRYLISLLLIAVLVACNGDSAKSKTTITGDDEYEVTIVFLGLHTIDLTDQKSVTIMLPSVKKDIKLGNGQKKVHKHVPYILATKSAMPIELNPQHKYDFEKPHGGEKVFRYLPLKGELISVADDNRAASSSLPLAYSTTGCGKCPAENNKFALCWLAGMKEIHDGKEQEKSAKHFKTKPDDDDVTARAVIQYGELRAHVIAYDRTPAPLWRFATPTEDGNDEDYLKDEYGQIKEKALAQEVHWIFNAKGSPFILNLFDFDGSIRSVAFQPANKKLMIFVGNTTKTDTGPVTEPSEAKRDDHYSAYHRFIEGNTKGLGRIPFPVDVDVDACQPAHSVLFRPALIEAFRMAQGGPRFTVAIDFRKSNGKPSPGGLNCSGNPWP